MRGRRERQLRDRQQLEWERGLEDLEGLGEEEEVERKKRRGRRRKGEGGKGEGGKGEGGKGEGGKGEGGKDGNNSGEGWFCGRVCILVVWARRIVCCIFLCVGCGGRGEEGGRKE